MQKGLILLAIVVTAGAAAVAAGTAAWRRGTARKVEALTTGAVTPTLVDRAGLPAPVARYFARALAVDQPIVHSAVATQDAEFFINGGWQPLTATQHFTAARPGFVWDASIRMAPLLPAWVRDAYVGGQGSMQASIYGLYELVDQAATPELNAGALQRFLAEAVWLPTALLPSAALSWTPRDERSATATLVDGATSVSLLFEFNAEDDVVRISGERYKEAGGAYALRPWVVSCGEHRERSGLRIPVWCEVAWLDAGQPAPYWRGRIAAITYQVGAARQP
jgi:hypothetical protein